MGMLRRAEADVEEYRRTLLARDTRISLGRWKRDRERFRTGIVNDGGEDPSPQFLAQVENLLIIGVGDVGRGYRRS